MSRAPEQFVDDEEEDDNKHEEEEEDEHEDEDEDENPNDRRMSMRIRVRMMMVMMIIIIIISTRALFSSCEVKVVSERTVCCCRERACRLVGRLSATRGLRDMGLIHNPRPRSNQLTLQREQ